MSKRTWWQRLLDLFTGRIEAAGAAQIVAILALLEALRTEILRDLGGAGDKPLSATLLDALIGRLIRQMSIVDRELPALADAALERAFEAGIQAADDIATRWDIPAPPSPGMDRGTLRILSDYNADLIRRGVTEQVRTDIANRIRTAFLTGESPFEVMKDLSRRDIDPLQFGSRMRRAEVIVRTELAKLANQAEYERVASYQADTAGPWLKKWRSAEDERVRPTHVAADDAPPVRFDEFFEVGGHRARRPHDPALPASEVINCRCVALYIPPGASL